ncbi:MAG: DNA-processing protein DprA [Gemmatimonadota bacterium]
MVGRLLKGRREVEWRTRAFLRLRLLPGVGDLTVKRLVEEFGSPQDALAAARTDFAQWTSRAAAAERDRADVHQRVDEIMRRVAELKLTTLVLGQEGYPKLLREHFVPPPVLFLKGDLKLLERRSVAIVGARRASGYGRRVAAALAADLAARDVVVVSGMARGVDAAAHRGCLDADGGTIAVLGSGLDVPYPASNRGLFREIVRKGLVVSEFLPGEGALPHHFPRRNRVIAGLSGGVVVVEAAAKSGALHTVRHATSLGLEVFALPGSVEDGRSAGCHDLIRDGSKLVTDVAHIFKELRWSEGGIDVTEDPGEPPAYLGADARLLWQEMEMGGSHLDDLIARAGLTSARGLAAASMLELSGWVVQEAGRRFARSARGTFDA